MSDAYKNRPEILVIKRRSIPLLRYFGYIWLSAIGSFSTIFIAIVVGDLWVKPTDRAGLLLAKALGILVIFSIVFLPFIRKIPHFLADSNGLKLVVAPVFSSELVGRLYFSRVFGRHHLQRAILYMQAESLRWPEIKRITVYKKYSLDLYQVRIVTKDSKGRVVFASFRHSPAVKVSRQLQILHRMSRATPGR